MLLHNATVDEDLPDWKTLRVMYKHQESTSIGQEVLHHSSESILDADSVSRNEDFCYLCIKAMRIWKKTCLNVMEKKLTNQKHCNGLKTGIIFLK